MPGHNLVFGVVIAALCARWCSHPRAVFLLSLLAFHLHLICNLAGSMGPDGYQWPIRYLYPFAVDFELAWTGQWQLMSSWKNSAIGVLFFLIAIILARYRKVTFFELFSMRLEEKVRKVATERGFFR